MNISMQEVGLVARDDEFDIDTLIRLPEIIEICQDTETFFRDWHHFVSESISLCILWWTKPDRALKAGYKWFPHYSDEMKEEMEIILKKKGWEKYVDDAERICKKEGVALNPPKMEFVDRPYQPFSVDEIRMDMIKEIVEKNRYYSTPGQFFDNALDLMITFWKEGPLTAYPKWVELFPYLDEEQRKIIKEYSLETYTQLEKDSEELQKKKEEMKVESKDVGDTLQSLGRYDEAADVQIMETLHQSVGTEPTRVLSSMEEIESDAKRVITKICTELEDTQTVVNDLSLEKKITKLTAAKLKDDGLITGNLPYDNYPLIWSFYSRFFPVKIVVSVLAEMIADNNGEKVEYEQFRERAYEASLGLAVDIKEYEKKWGRKRNLKISAGLPQPPVDERYLSPRSLAEKMNKFDSSKERFQNHFIGISQEAWNKKQNSKAVKDWPDKPIKNEKEVAYFDGVLNAMGLANFEVEKVGEKERKDGIQYEYEIKVSLTPDGAEFYRKRNPVLLSYMDKRGEQKIALSPDESDFIMKKIIPRFSLEETLVSKVTDILKSEKLSSSQIDDQLVVAATGWLQNVEKNNKKEEWEKIPWYKIITAIRSDSSIVTPWRVATMGRLSEMKIVDWKILSSTGSSEFSLSKQK